MFIFNSSLMRFTNFETTPSRGVDLILSRAVVPSAVTFTEWSTSLTNCRSCSVVTRFCNYGDSALNQAGMFSALSP
jgi:hypothetical protein